MSQQPRPVPTLVTVCDLCDEEITEQQAARKSSLAHGYGGHPDPRNWAGQNKPSYEEQRASPKRWGYRHYDFHTECLLKLVEDAIAARGES